MAKKKGVTFPKEDDMELQDEELGFEDEDATLTANSEQERNSNLDYDLNDNLDDFGMGLDDMYGRPTPMDKHSDLLKGLTKFSPFLRTLYNNWLGIVWDETSKTYKLDKNLKPIMNLIGANWHCSFIQTYVRENNILAHLNRDEYYNLLEDINRTLLLTYAKRHKEFGFNCYSDVIRVWNEVEDASLLALSGAGGGKYSDFLGGGIVQYRGSFNEQHTDAPNQPQKRGMFKRLSDWATGNSPNATARY